MCHLSPFYFNCQQPPLHDQLYYYYFYFCHFVIHHYNHHFYYSDVHILCACVQSKTVLETGCFDRLLGKMVDVLKRRCCTYRYIEADVYLDLVRAAAT